jgi:hypothetical protein
MSVNVKMALAVFKAYVNARSRCVVLGESVDVASRRAPVVNAGSICPVRKFFSNGVKERSFLTGFTSLENIFFK